ncbi:TlpA family protein disulfide reductase [Tenacibaculum sp. M341]|uniref:TlpA family protein disulfide reductase n=1 Tax=Tenacibaculum sp. M341 TaxID=2530339 RepID=UPI0010462C7F|nr:TlpA disulfide reductase family protein [Tenacibaculum sp. M341]TCI90166.1 TlpA family protein disulfide reductase [Tenacibaculum sp. M341]
MKKIFYVLFISFAVISCKKKDYVTLSGKITNNTSDSLLIVNADDSYRKVIIINKDGSFKDTLKIETGNFHYATEGASNMIYLKNGFNSKMNFDVQNFTETIQFLGDGKHENQYLQDFISNEGVFFEDLQTTMNGITEAAFTDKINTYMAKVDEMLTNENLDAQFITSEKEKMKKFAEEAKLFFDASITPLLKLEKGTASPKFVNYENFDGTKSSLDDFKGKYVYIDFWATWCNPCLSEIPSLKEVEKKYHDKNIEFVSISIDDKEDHDAWKNMVKDKELTGIQLYANRDTEFTSAYAVNSIPRFILIDPDGNIVTPDAPSPSNPLLIELFDSLKI